MADLNIADALVVNLKVARSYIDQYVNLRNQYTQILLTRSVTAEETEKWLNSGEVSVRCLVLNGKVIGAVILNFQRDGEVTFFAAVTGRGIGQHLLAVIEKVAREKKLEAIWAWVLNENEAAQKAFIKSGYAREKEMNRIYEGRKVNGICFRKSVRNYGT